MEVINIGVIGYGYWGPNLVRNFSDTTDARVVTIADWRRDRLDLAQRRYPSVTTTTSHADILNCADIDAVAIATPVSTHFPLALEALQAGKHVFVEKPMTTTSEEALRLIDEADRRGLTLMVDHTFVYTGAVRKIRELIENGSIGDLYYYDSTRINLGLFQQDVDVIWDLAAHDISILSYIVPDSPVEVSATGISHVPGAVENVAYVTAFFDTSLIAHLNVNWLSPVKMRRTLLGGSKQMIVYDDIENSEKIKVYDKGVTVKNGAESLHKLLVSYRSGDMYAPQIDVTEALKIETQHFVDCISNQRVPITDGFAGLRVVRVLEAATRSMRERGRAVSIKPMPALKAVAATGRS